MAQLSAICMFFEVVCLAFLLQYIYAAIKAKVTVEEIGDTFINVLGDMYERHRFRTIVIMLGASILAYNPQKFAVRLFFMFPYLFAIPGIILIAWALATKK